MGVPIPSQDPMTVEEFLAFTDTRPDEEKWELLAGEPVLNASASRLHQLILLNLLFVLSALERERGGDWEVLPGLGVRVSRTDLPQPDALIRPRGDPGNDPMGRVCDDMIVAFEILSPSTESRDLRWKRQAYTGMGSVAHYVVIAQDTVEVVDFARSSNFLGQRL